ARSPKAKGFTLVEILIVVVILGILAAIVIPQFTSASEAAKASSLSTQLQSIRSQLQLYQIEHNGNYPDELGTDWDQFTETTDINGDVVANNGGDYGPYMQKPPANPFVAGANATAVSQVDAVGTDPAFAANTGWSYNSVTGEIRANIPNTVDAEELGLDDEPNDFNVQAAP
ncbi:MAG: prepilin-type N-terminal cleavage/methylation domain-containing protein, partial [Planctomycetota bacterium]